MSKCIAYQITAYIPTGDIRHCDDSNELLEMFSERHNENTESAVSFDSYTDFNKACKTTYEMHSPLCYCVSSYIAYDADDTRKRVGRYLDDLPKKLQKILKECK